MLETRKSGKWSNMKQADIKYTNQRIEILEFLKEFDGHPTVDDVYEGVRQKLTRISKATVYNNLKFLAEKGLIKEVNVKGVSRFEANLVPHHHTICLECGEITDYQSEELSDYAMKIAEQIDDFRIESADTNFYGICKKCMEME
ncbi:Fur family transcriptional regulator, ferric uptake regulator [Methanolobus vulcani]|jgi:Fur family ferric uptake transcriptional regulator|uniref:Fur family transcriptional regulator, ferric uptake regulator n=2 Tax=Methanolobus vulcani TaxID=38026 RepID=A0A7Z7FBU1_9EURY|nr:Fur family transcriptional regulator, ferric uptake regulator [Methanolobus sp.]MDK2947392.1 Fur family transcriptional regulator, ferric uptake regulator [Methanolobus sp.]SDF33783.1 Fur family transcriptional regulator, ferric uptake regulator [Methanolobus vulcani]